MAARWAPGVCSLLQEGAISLRSHFREDARGACIIDRISDSVRKNREGSGRCGKTDLRCKIRGICWIGRFWTKVLNFAHGCPGDVKRRRRVVRSRATDECVVDCALFGQMEARCPIAHEERIIGNGNNPKQT